MIKRCLVLFLVLVGLFGSGLAFATDSKVIVRVGVYDNNPKIYKDTDGKIKGFWADITNYIAEKENWEVVYVYDTWENNLKRLGSGEIDMMVDVAVSEERKNLYSFNNETALIAWGLLYTKKGLKVNSFEDLKDKKIAIMKSGILYAGPLGLKDMLSSFGVEANIVDVSVYGDVFKLLDSGQVDIGAVNYFYGITNEDKYKVERTNIMFQPSELKYALVKDAAKNDYLIRTIDNQLRALKEDKNSVYNRSIRVNFGKFIVKEEVIPVWIKYSILAISLVLIVLIIISLVMGQYQKALKRQVKEKASEIEFKNIILTTQQETSLDGILVVDEKGAILGLNKKFEDIFGNGSNKKGLTSVASKLKESGTFTKKLTHLNEDKDEISREEITLLDGRILDCYSAPMKDNDNKFYGRVWYFRDITERKKNEAMFKSKYDEMERLYSVSVERELKMSELKKENEELEAKMSTRG